MKERVKGLERLGERERESGEMRGKKDGRGKREKEVMK